NIREGCYQQPSVSNCITTFLEFLRSTPYRTPPEGVNTESWRLLAHAFLILLLAPFASSDESPWPIQARFWLSVFSGRVNRHPRSTKKGKGQPCFHDWPLLMPATTVDFPQRSRRTPTHFRVQYHSA